jgi:hypothetical protein
VVPPASERASFAILDEIEAKALFGQAASGRLQVVWADPFGRSGTGRIVEDGDEVLLEPEDGAEPAGDVRIAFILYGVPFYVSGPVSARRFVGPMRMWSADNRASARVTASAMHIEWCSLDGDRVQVERAPLLEIGSDGARSIHPPGTPVPAEPNFAATVSTPSSFFHCMVEVRSRKASERGLELGLRFFHDDRGAIAEVMLQAMFPQITLRRKVPAEMVVELFERSRYLSLRAGCRPSDQWLRLDADAVSRDLTYLAQDGLPVGHVSISRAYRHAWLGHQIATLSDHADSLDARLSLYLSFAMLPPLLDGPGAMLLGYYDRSKPWHQIFFEEFVRSANSPALAVTTALDRFERARAPLVLDAEVPSDIRVDRVTRRDEAIVAEIARRPLPTLLADALDLRPSRLCCSTLHPAYDGTALCRGREAFLLRVQGQIVGAALCETTTRDMSLFNIMNMAQVFLVDRRVSPLAQRVLQHEVRRFYADQGIADPLLVAPPNTFDATLDPHVKLAETMGCIVWSSEGLRAFENYVRLRFAWLQQGRRATGRPKAHAAAPVEGVGARTRRQQIEVRDE